MRGLRMLLIGALLGWVAALGYVNAQGDDASGDLTGADPRGDPATGFAVQPGQ